MPCYRRTSGKVRQGQTDTMKGVRLAFIHICNIVDISAWVVSTSKVFQGIFEWHGLSQHLKYFREFFSEFNHHQVCYVHAV